jgi:hypothetical protein
MDIEVVWDFIFPTILFQDKNNTFKKLSIIFSAQPLLSVLKFLLKLNSPLLEEERSITVVQVMPPLAQATYFTFYVQFVRKWLIKLGIKPPIIAPIRIERPINPTPIPAHPPTIKLITMIAILNKSSPTNTIPMYLSYLFLFNSIEVIAYNTITPKVI